MILFLSMLNRNNCICSSLYWESPKPWLLLISEFHIDIIANVNWHSLCLEDVFKLLNFIMVLKSKRCWLTVDFGMVRFTPKIKRITCHIHLEIFQNQPNGQLVHETEAYRAITTWFGLIYFQNITMISYHLSWHNIFFKLGWLSWLGEGG